MSVPPKMELEVLMATAASLVDRIKPILAGQHPNVQAMALAELVAILVRDHRSDNAERQAEVRSAVIRLHAWTVGRLVGVNDLPE